MVLFTIQVLNLPLGAREKACAMGSVNSLGGIVGQGKTQHMAWCQVDDKQLHSQGCVGCTQETKSVNDKEHPLKMQLKLETR